ncbi:MAG TPA: translation elongation factor Ts [Candidatus Vogelbacteria bacterium]|nr:MAG: Elongation factor Ts [Parcubacteria group bacterium GW2011_GWC1_51_35]KKW24750.1 MAG: Elongation factor Ts [Parcubacteria group bacterium GW2011_GWF2_52_12]KKW27927.1 MAG: Elongation factor Ts [Parcubacteria group bacterium GW2011_GWF1_52_5]HBB65135.1 translation elongation factor Ts [Candidatus Vogelbacteria bacterium]HBC44059.1 translation elongation factor Ts [Candidatus Vogelbacteria bacterium]
MISTADVKELREKTGISFAQCKKALEDAGGNPAKALESLKAQGEVIAAKKSKREVKAGVIHAYVHATGALGAMVELNCETDFVAKNPEFVALARDIAMQVTASAPADTTELLAQPFIKDASLTVDALVKSRVQKFGENITVPRFIRFSVLG